ncbi:MAG: tRNA uridine-5-carboxymethylaminomethyl(34) synthesis GTPase MnmE [Bacteroidales bacterium]
MLNTDTICAIATPAGSGAIATLRVSGRKSISLVDKIFYAAKKHKSLKTQEAYTALYGYIKDGDELVDQVLVTVFRKPKSYTGEDAVEISCHGSIYIQQKILGLLIKTGIRLAFPGEFTQRAFLNGKMDLSQAEAVADLIASSSAASHKIALNQVRGGFSKELNALRDRLLNFISLIELELDFSEEDVEFVNRKQLLELLEEIRSKVENLVKSFKLGNVIKNGVPVAIIGEPNVGKSTLLNALVNEEKAIVSEIAGTTRDAIEDVLNIDGILFRFIDTAGLRQTDDTIENLGIEKTIQKINQAEIIILVTEASNNWQLISQQVKHTLDKYNIKEQKLIVLLNKSDKIKPDSETILKLNEQLRGIKVFDASAKTNQNIDKLKEVLKREFSFVENENNVVVSNIRHFEALSNALGAIERAIEGMAGSISSEFIAMDIRQVMHYLGEITGQISTDEILGNIFRNFCIGK